MRGLWLARTFGGTLMDVGLALFAFNIAMTMKRSPKQSAADADPAGGSSQTSSQTSPTNSAASPSAAY